jgi:hypothetical protein
MMAGTGRRWHQKSSILAANCLIKIRILGKMTVCAVAAKYGENRN